MNAASHLSGRICAIDLLFGCNSTPFSTSSRACLKMIFRTQPNPFATGRGKSLRYHWDNLFVPEHEFMRKIIERR